MEDSLRLGHLNDCSLYPKFNDLRYLILENDFDIFAVTETWLDNRIQSEDIGIDGYVFVRRDRASRGWSWYVFTRIF